MSTGRSKKQANHTDSAIRSVTVIAGEPGTSGRSIYKEIGEDVYFYVSGSRDVDGVEEKRVAVFGGDVVISGSLRVEGCELTGSFNFDCDTLELTGSIDVEGVGRFTENISTTNITTLEGDPFFVAGTGLVLSTAASGQITVSAKDNITWNEKLTGDVDGMNKEFLLSGQPVSSNSLMVFMNGVLQEFGSMNDFTLDGAKVVFINAPPVGSKIIATYSK